VECSRIPVQVIGGHIFGEIDAGFSHTCAVNAAREVYCWGSNTHGELGTGLYYGGSALPERVAGPDTYLSAVAGKEFSCALTQQGAVKCWGSGVDDALGSTPATMCPSVSGVRCTPTPAAVEATRTFSQLAAGDHHVCAITSSLEAFCWGSNSDGQLGIEGISRTYVPSQVAAPAGTRVIQLSAGTMHSCAITDDYDTLCWGANRSGQLGTGETLPGPFAPGLVSGGLVFASVHAGGNTATGHTCGLTPTRQIFCWGAREFGQIGDGK